MTGPSAPDHADGVAPKRRNVPGVRAERSSPYSDEDRSAEHPVARPAVRTLGVSHCRAILARNRVGRIAFAARRSVDIEPIHYVYHDGWIFGRTSPGAKAAALRSNPWVALEVDEVEGVFDWRSVVVHGTLYFLGEEGTPSTVATRETAVALLRRLVPDLATPQDPAADRSLVFGIHVKTYSGRASRTEE